MDASAVEPEWRRETTGEAVSIIQVERGPEDFRDILYLLVVASKRLRVRGIFAAWRFTFTVYGEWALREAKIEVRFQPLHVDTGEREPLCVTHTVLRPVPNSGDYGIIMGPGSAQPGRIPVRVVLPVTAETVGLQDLLFDALRATVAFTVLHELDECLFVKDKAKWYPMCEHGPLPVTAVLG